MKAAYYSMHVVKNLTTVNELIGSQRR